MNTKVQINWDDINQNDYQYFNAIVREHSTYKEMLYLNEQNYHNIYLRKHFITFEGNKYFIPNPFVSLFFEKDHTIIPDFITNYKKGQKHFKKNYHKKAPDENYIERMKQLFNDEFKRILTGIEFIYNDKVGFRNGLLSAYIEFEEANYDLFESLSKPKKEENKIKYKTKHYLLAYLFECSAKGESYPIGNKKELESIGNERMGAGKGNRFYKVFNEVISKDLNVVNNLIEIGGEHWREAVIELSKAPELVEQHLQSKQL